MPKVVYTCPYHFDIAIENQFSTCSKCVREFMEKHGIWSPLAEEEYTVIGFEDIIVEMDDILLKEELCSKLSEPSSLPPSLPFISGTASRSGST